VEREKNVIRHSSESRCTAVPTVIFTISVFRAVRERNEGRELTHENEQVFIHPNSREATLQMINQGNAKFTMKLLKEMLCFLLIYLALIF
jgi:hypothetical protein